MFDTLFTEILCPNDGWVPKVFDTAGHTVCPACRLILSDPCDAPPRYSYPGDYDAEGRKQPDIMDEP